MHAGVKAFLTSTQLGIGDKLANAVALATSPVVKALFNFDAAMVDVRNLDDVTFSQWFEVRMSVYVQTCTYQCTCIAPYRVSRNLASYAYSIITY